MMIDDSPHFGECFVGDLPVIRFKLSDNVLQFFLRVMERWKSIVIRVISCRQTGLKGFVAPPSQVPIGSKHLFLH